MLRNILTRSVPSLTGVYAERVLDTVLQRARLSRTDIGEWTLHAGGRDVLQVIEKALNCSRKIFATARR